MPELVEGTYYVVNAGSGMVMETATASDAKNNNVDQNTNVQGDSQIWSVTDQGNGWQFICSLSNKCLNIYGGIAAGKNVNVWDDNNGAAQRWSVVPDNNTYTYKGTTYDTFTVHPYSNANLALAVYGNSTAAKANIQINTTSTAIGQRWAFVPASVFTDNGTYFIAPAQDLTKTLVVNSGSDAAGANVFLWTMREVNHQIVRTVVNQETYNTKFYFAHSNKCLDILNGSSAVAGRNVQQWTPNSAVGQLWFPVANGTVKNGSESYPAYVLRAVTNAGLALDTANGKLTAGTNVLVNTRNWSASQRWVFIKTEAIGNDIEMPGSVEQSEFHRDGIGDVVVEGLTFLTNETQFQARYKIRRYKANRTSYTDSAWLNFDDDSSSRSGWGDAWTYTFTANPVEGRVTIPYSKTVTLDNTYKSAELIIEVRAYRDEYGSGYKAHGPVAQSVVNVLQTPSVDVQSSSFSYDTFNGRFGISTTLQDSLGEGCSYLRGRILGEDGKPISEWQASSSMTVTHSFGSSLIRLPYANESLTFEYSMLTNEGLAIFGKKSFSLSYIGTANITVDSIDEGTLTVVVSGSSDRYEHCFVEVPSFGRSKLVENIKLGTSENISQWKCVPPLNKDVRIVKIGSSNGTDWTYGETTVHIDSHLFIWNWTDIGSKDYYESSAAVIINTDNPPEQTMTYSSSLTFSSPSGRVHPVAFANSNISSDMSIRGVIVDDGVQYQAAGPIPESTKRDRVLLLSTLSGNGIHPLYRTPYGDWSQVAIETVDVSKTERYISNASITQRSVED